MRPADLLIVNARPWSDGRPVAHADTVAIQGGQVLAVGRAEELEAVGGPATRRLDARGATVTPGISDAHLHLVAWARALREVRLDGAGTRRAAVAAVAERAAAATGSGTIVGRGWSAEGWEAPPDRAALDAVAGERPVLLHSRDFHSLWTNTAAMRLAGVGAATRDPEGGRIERRPDGEPSGVFRENAVRLFEGLTDPPAVASDLEGVSEAVARLHALGVTAVHDFEGDAEAEVLRALTRGAGPWVRVLMHLPRAALDRALASRLVSGEGDDRFAWGALKLFADGTLGSRTAAMLEPYDGTEETGLELIPRGELMGLVGRAMRGGISVAIHAIGDRAVRVGLDAFEDCGAALARLPLPPRIEHAQLVHDDDRPRFAALGIVASMQPAHCTSDRPLAERYWRSRVGRAYPWRTLLDDGVPVAFGSDAPVEPPSPAMGIHAAVTREHPGTPGDPFVPAQRISLDEALSGYTEVPARLAGAWPRRGRLAPGCVADLVVWNLDLHRTLPTELHRAAPVYTCLDGALVFESSTDAREEATARGGRR
jgi:hypothetical protein